MLPNFLCIGAQKAGTTTLWLLLNQHPDVFLATPRETCFFYDDVLYGGGITSYERNFFREWNGQKAVGEKAPARIKDSLGDKVKLIVTLRSPAKRAHSHFRHNYQQLWEEFSFEDALQK
jgi:predicted acyl esterase